MANKVQKHLEALLDIRQAAQFLNVSQTSLRRWTKSGRLACVRVGGKRERRFRREDLLELVEQQPAAATAAARSAHGAEGHSHTAIAGITVPSGAHFCGLYTNDDGRTSQAAGFLADGLHPGSVCFLVAQPAARDQVLDRLERGTGSVGLDIDAGRLVVGEYLESPQAMWESWESHFVAALRNGARSIRVVGDVWGCRDRGMTSAEVVEYEEGYDARLARRFPVVTLCQYDMRRFSSLDLFSALKGHRDMFRYPAERLLD